AIALTNITRPSRSTVGGAVERGVDANVTTQLDAGVGARDIEEPRTIQGADPDLLDSFGLDGKIGSLGSAQGDDTRSWAENKALDHSHVKPTSCSARTRTDL